MRIIPKTVLIAHVKIWTVYCFVCRVNFQALIGWGAKTKACKPIINQVEKTQFDYAASVSAYSDSVLAYGDRDCFSRCIYFFRFVFSENKKTFRNFILQIYNKKTEVGQWRCFSCCYSHCFRCCYSHCFSITCLFIIVFFFQMELLGIIIVPKK